MWSTPYSYYVTDDRLPGGRVPQGAGGGHQGAQRPPHQSETSGPWTGRMAL